MAQPVKQVLQILVSTQPAIANGFYLIGDVGIFVYASPDYDKDGLLLIVAEGHDNTSIQSALAEFVSTKPPQRSAVSETDRHTMLRTLVGLSRKFAAGSLELDIDIRDLLFLSRPEQGGSGVPLALEMFGENSDEENPEEEDT
jgi:hypothetical protein